MNYKIHLIIDFDYMGYLRIIWLQTQFLTPAPTFLMQDCESAIVYRLFLGSFPGRVRVSLSSPEHREAALN